jgi:hypothetical protein
MRNKKPERARRNRGSIATFLPVILLLLSFARADAGTKMSIGANVLRLANGLENGLGYDLGLEKGVLEYSFFGIYSGIRATYIPVRIKSRFVINAPHHLFYFGIPVGMLARYRAGIFEPFIGLETQLDFMAIDIRENEPDMFCNLNGECTDFGPGIQSESYDGFIIRASPKIGCAVIFSKSSVFFASGMRSDLTPFSHRGGGQTRTSSFLIGTGLTF